MPGKHVNCVLGAALALSAAGAPALAHHSFAIFDKTKSVTVTGTVKSFDWENPHVWIEVLVNDPASGKQILWPVEAPSTINLDGMGWTRDSMKVGDTVTITMQPLRNGKTGGSLVSATKDGKLIGHPGFRQHK